MSCGECLVENVKADAAIGVPSSRYCSTLSSCLQAISVASGRSLKQQQVCQLKALCIFYMNSLVKDGLSSILTVIHMKHVGLFDKSLFSILGETEAALLKVTAQQLTTAIREINGFAQASLSE